HERETFRGLTNREVVSDTLPGPKFMREHIVDGRLRLTLQDAITLALANNSNVRLQELNIEFAKYNLLGTHGTFDPFLQVIFSADRASTQQYSILSATPTLASPLSTLTQSTQVNYFQTFETGTSVQAGFNSNRISSNSLNNFINPSYSTGLNFQFT